MRLSPTAIFRTGRASAGAPSASGHAPRPLPCAPRRPPRAPALAVRGASLLLVASCMALAPAGPALAAPPDPQLLERAVRILEMSPLVDGHNDLPWQIRDRADGHLDVMGLDGSGARNLDPPLQTDIPRLRDGHVGGVFWSVYVPVDLPGADAVRATFEQIDLVHRMVARWPDAFALALTADDVERAFRAGRVASLIGMEGGHSIGGSLAVLRQAYAAGARYMTLTHWKNVDWADAATDAPKHKGLTAFGKEVVREMNRLGMLVDLSHVSAATMNDALDTSEAPVIFSHSGARAICGHVRNVPDAVLRRLKDNGGVAMVNFLPGFVSEDVRLRWSTEKAEKARLESLHMGDPDAAAAAFKVWRKGHPAPRATLAQVADHIDHIRKVAGVDHVGLGSDFDGMEDVPKGLEDVSRYPALLAELLRRGYSDDDVAKIAGGNVLRAFRQAEVVAARLRGERPASEARIEELDGGVPAKVPGGASTPSP